MDSIEKRIAMLEAQQLQLLNTINRMQGDMTGQRPAKRTRYTESDDDLKSLAESLEQAEDKHRDLPSVSDVTAMDRQALRDLWQQIGSMGRLRSNASEATMRRAIKRYISTHTK